jgi:hypothetical protein
MDTMSMTVMVAATLCAMAWYCCYRFLQDVAAAERAKQPVRINQQPKRMVSSRHVGGNGYDGSTDRAA